MDKLIDIAPFVIKFLPTILYIFIICSYMYRGYISGKKKSMYMLINTVVAMVLSLITFLIIDLDLIMKIASLLVPEFNFEGHTPASYVLSLFPDNKYMTEVIVDIGVVYVELILNLVLFLFLHLFVYGFFRAILLIIYLVFKSAKVKVDIAENGRKRGGGVLFGAIRGLLVGFLIFSQISTIYCIAAGNLFYSEDEYKSIIVDGEVWEYDEMYKALKTSRSYGLGLMFDKIANDTNTPIDYLFVDFFVKSTYSSDNYKVQLTLREELSNIVGVVESLLDSGVVIYSNGGVTFQTDKIDDIVITNLTKKLSNIKTITDIMPVALLDTLRTQYNIDIDDKYLVDLDLKNDLDIVAKLVCDFINIIDLTDLTNLNIDFADIDEEFVDSIIDCVSQLTFLTKFALPLGVKVANEVMEDLVFDLDSILWDKEIQNLKGLYGLFLKLDIDFNTDTFEDILNDSEKLEVVDKIVSQIFNSDLLFELSVTTMTYAIENIFSDNIYFKGVEHDFENYTKDDLLFDVKVLINTGINGIKVFEELDFDLENFLDIDITPIELLFFGDQFNTGILDMNIIECIGLNVIVSNVIRESMQIDIPNIPNLRMELNYLFDSVKLIQNLDIDMESLGEGDFSVLSDLSEETTDELQYLVTNSIVLSCLAVESLKAQDGGTIIIPEDLEWYGENGELTALLDSLFFIIHSDMLDGLLEGDFTSILDMESDDLYFVLKSDVLHATLATHLDSAISGSIEVPEEAYVNDVISKDEIINVFNSLKELGISDLENFDFDINTLMDLNHDVIFKSIILSYKTIEMLSEVFYVPDYIFEYHHIRKQEILSLINAIRILDLNLDDFDANSIIQNENLVDALDSIILHYTISNQVIASGIPIVYEYDTEIVIEFDIISKQEIINTLNAYKLLDISIEDFGSISLETIASLSNEQLNSILDSNILSTIISELLIAQFDSFIDDNSRFEAELYNSSDKIELIYKSKIIELLELYSSLS